VPRYAPYLSPNAGHPKIKIFNSDHTGLPINWGGKGPIPGVDEPAPSWEPREIPEMPAPTEPVPFQSFNRFDSQPRPTNFSKPVAPQKAKTRTLSSGGSRRSKAKTLEKHISGVSVSSKGSRQMRSSSKRNYQADRATPQFAKSRTTTHAHKVDGAKDKDDQQVYIKISLSCSSLIGLDGFSKCTSMVAPFCEKR